MGTCRRKRRPSFMRRNRCQSFLSTPVMSLRRRRALALIGSERSLASFWSIGRFPPPARQLATSLTRGEEFATSHRWWIKNPHPQWRSNEDRLSIRLWQSLGGFFDDFGGEFLKGIPTANDFERRA